MSNKRQTRNCEPLLTELESDITHCKIKQQKHKVKMVTKSWLVGM